MRTTLALLALLMLPAAASAAVRYTDPAATPVGAGAACTELVPCALVDAVNHATGGDEVRLQAEEYWLESALVVGAPNLTIAGPERLYLPNDNRAWIFFRPQSGECPTCPSAPSAKITVTASGDNLTLRRLNITGRRLSGTMFDALLSSVVKMEQVQIEDEGSARGVVAQDLRMSNSIVRQSSAGPSDVALEATGEITASTITSDGGIALSNDDNWHLPAAGDRCDLVVQNTIAIGTARNLEAENSGSDCVPTVSISESWIPQSGTGGGVYENTPPGDPRLITFATGNLADAPTALVAPLAVGTAAITPGMTSPAVNAGCAGCVSNDFFGRPRPIGAGVDIGAIEIYLPPALAPPTVSAINANSATFMASLNPNGAISTATFQVRPAGSPTWESLPPALSGAGTTAEAVAIVATGLRADTAYEVRLIASNVAGASESAVVSLRTSTASAGGADGSVPAEAPLQIISLRAAAGVLRTRVQVSGPGVLVQRITTAGKARPAWCSVRRAFPRAGVYTLSCRLDRRAQAKLRRASLRLAVQTVFTPTTGTRTSVVRTVRMPRR